MILPGTKLYFVGIGGVGMSSVAGLMQHYGCVIEGSDQGLFSPTKEVLESLSIAVNTPYSAQNVQSSNAELFVIANCLSRGHPEVEYILENKLPYTSFPELLAKTLLPERIPVVVCGTHGKTTVSSLLSHCLLELGESPSFFIGGRPENFSSGFSLKDHSLFVLEGDEYDTAFFDKGSKFLHYAPQFLLLNNLEYDHVDIFPDFKKLLQSFRKLIKLVQNPRQIIANIDNKNIAELLQAEDIYHQVYKVSSFGLTPDSDLCVKSNTVVHEEHSERFYSEIIIQSKIQGEIKLRSPLLGEHNAANIAMVLGGIETLKNNQKIKNFDLQRLLSGIASFSGIKKRLEYLGKKSGAPLYFDFAHHPTAVSTTIKTVRQMYPEKRLIAAFEPKNATSRRNIFMDQYAESLNTADQVLIAPCHEDKRIPAALRMSTESIQHKIGEHARAFQRKEELKEWLVSSLTNNDVVVFMSCGTFLEIPCSLLND